MFRAERDWSQADLAARLGVSRQAVNAVETGKHDPSLPLAFRLARVFGMSIEEIFEDERTAWKGGVSEPRGSAAACFPFLPFSLSHYEQGRITT